LVLVEQAFRWNQLEDIYAVERPAVRLRAGPQLIVGLGQRDIQRAFARGRTSDEELRGNGRLPSSGTAFEQEEPASGEAAHGDIVESLDPQVGFFTRLRHSLAPATSVAFNAASPRSDPPPTEFAC